MAKIPHSKNYRSTHQTSTNHHQKRSSQEDNQSRNDSDDTNVLTGLLSVGAGAFMLAGSPALAGLFAVTAIASAISSSNK